MKNFIKYLVLAVTVCVSPLAFGQAGIDVFNSTRVVQLAVPQVTPGATTPITNSPVDISGFIGRADIICNVYTNGHAASGSWTVLIQGSPDTTNWTSVANFATITSTTSTLITNLFYGVTTNDTYSLIVTNNYLQPFTATTPTPWNQIGQVGGFNTPYPAWNLFTNAAGTVSLGNVNTTVIGVDFGSSGNIPRYLDAIVTPTAGAEQGFFSIQMVGTQSKPGM